MAFNIILSIILLAALIVIFFIIDDIDEVPNYIKVMLIFMMLSLFLSYHKDGYDSGFEMGKKINDGIDINTFIVESRQDTMEVGRNIFFIKNVQDTFYLKRK